MSDQAPPNANTEPPAQQSEAGAQPPAEGTTPPVPDTGSAGDDPAAELEKWKSLARKHEERAKANATAAEELARIKDAEKTEAERMAEQLETERAERLAMARELAATRAGLPPEMAARLQGSTPEELAEDAKKLAETLKVSTAPPTPRPPAADAGPRGNEEIPSIDDRIAEARRTGDSQALIKLNNEKLLSMLG
jgi:hypothetical protein